MLINNIENINPHVKFISYTGEFPNLCRGILILEIDGEQYEFGYTLENINESERHYDRFWESGGEVGFLGDYSSPYMNEGKWIINTLDIPEQFQKYATEIDEVFNKNVSYGCCGGCL